MNKDNFPLVALITGFVILLITAFGSRVDESGATLLPLLMLLAMCEVGVLFNGAGAYLAFARGRQEGFDPRGTGIGIACVLIALILLNRGFILWPG